MTSSEDRAPDVVAGRQYDAALHLLDRQLIDPDGRLVMCQHGNRRVAHAVRLLRDESGQDDAHMPCPDATNRAGFRSRFEPLWGAQGAFL